MKTQKTETDIRARLAEINATHSWILCRPTIGLRRVRRLIRMEGLQ